MCHNSLIENEQIEKYIENGMPTKVVKTIKHTMRKRAANEEVNNKLLSQLEEITPCPSPDNDISQKYSLEEAPHVFVSKCPFGHGKFTTPAATVYAPPLIPPLTTAQSPLTDNELDLANNNNLRERFPQLKTKTGGTKTLAADNANVITDLSGHFDDDNNKLLLATDNMYSDDILSKSTQLTREFANKMQQAIKRLQSSKVYTLLTKTTQPAHLVAIGIITFVLVTVWPEFIDGQEPKHQQEQHAASVPTQKMPRKNDMLALIAYLGAFSTHFGAQIWMTFVSGLSLYFSLPRHIFGQCQQILFPIYFAMNAALSITMLILYVKYFVNSWTLAKCIQLSSLSLTGAIELFVRLYLAPPLLHLMHEKYKIEGTIGSGKEIGSLVQGDLIKCPHYQRIHKAFRRIHMIVAICNIITMAGSCLQLYNIAGQLQITLVH